MKLIINGMEAIKGMEVTTFRGEKYILTGWKEPHKASSAGGCSAKRKTIAKIIQNGFVSGSQA